MLFQSTAAEGDGSCMVFPGPASFTYPSYGVLVRVVGGAGMVVIMACTINWVWWPGGDDARLDSAHPHVSHITARILLVVGTNVMH